MKRIVSLVGAELICGRLAHNACSNLVRRKAYLRSGARRSSVKMRFSHKVGLVAALLLTQYLWGVRFADAEVIYTYTGNDFTSSGTIGTPESATAYTTSDSVTGEFTLATPLGDNLTNYSFTPLSYSFNDGVDTLSSSNSYVYYTSFYVSTNGSGDITAWSIQ